MKKLLTLTLVALMVIAAFGLTSCDFGKQNDQQKEMESLEQQIAELQQVIDKLNQGLISAEEALKEFEHHGVDFEEWQKATEALPQKLEELSKAVKDFIESKTVYDEDGEMVLVSFNDLYEYYEYDWETGYGYSSIEVFEIIYTEAKQALMRALSISEMDAIIAGMVADFEAIPTMLERLYTALEAAEKNGVEYADYENILLALNLYNTHITNDYIYAPAAEGEKKGEKELIGDRIDVLLDEFKPTVVARFVELVNALPEVAQLAPSHEKALVAARKELEFVEELHTTEEFYALQTSYSGKITDFGKAINKLMELETRWVDIEKIIIYANRTNEILNLAFTKDNYDGFDVSKYGANLYTHTYIYSTLKDVIDWYFISNYIITDENDEDYNAELYYLVNQEIFEGYVAKFETVVSELRVKADEFIIAVMSIDRITPDSKAELDAVKDLFDKAASSMRVADMDIILGYQDYIDEDGEDVDIFGVEDAYNDMISLYAKYYWLVDAITALEDDVKEALIKCSDETHGKLDANGNVIECDCKDVGKYDYASIANHDAEILRIIAMYGLDESVFDEELLAEYKIARLLPYIYEAIENVEWACENSTYLYRDTLKEILIEEIYSISADYTFDAKFYCVNPENEDHECDCQYDLSNWCFAIEHDPAKELMEQYSPEVLADRFA